MTLNLKKTFSGFLITPSPISANCVLLCQPEVTTALGG